MSAPRVPPQFLLFNQELTKNLVVAIEFVGNPDIITNDPLFSELRYGDPDLNYGQAGLVYGGLRPYITPGGGQALSYVDMSKSSLVLSQVMEQEQGRASISQMTFAFVDKNGYMTNLVSPGRVFPTILGIEVIVRIGFKQISYPEQYWRVFRGRVQGVKITGPSVVIQMGDPNLRRRQSVFFTGTSTLDGAITNTQQVIDVDSNGDFHEQILGPDGSYDPDVRTFLKIEDEFIEYNGPAFLPNQFSNLPAGAVLTRGARGTTAVAHDDQSDVTCAVEIGGNPMAIALKLMLSGWQGPYVQNVAIANYVVSGDPVVGNQTRGILLANNKDAVLDLGIAVGDYITTTGSAISGNNQMVRVQNFLDVNGFPNAMIITDADFTPEIGTAGVLAVRSQYDTLPDNCGLKLYGWEVDVQAHQDIIATVLGGEQFLFFLQEQEDSGKTFCEQECYLPVGAYSLTRFGTLSVKMAGPPIAGQVLPILDKTNVTDASLATTEIGLTNRNFWNEIDFDYDYDDDGDPQQSLKFLDASSLDDTEYLAVLPIPTRGTRAALTPIGTIQARAQRLLNRYSLGAILLTVTVNMKIGATLEVGDIVLVRDNGGLKLPNLATGKRDLVDALYEIKQMSLDFTNDKITIVLLSNQNYVIGDIFATWAPSSKCLSIPALGMGQIRITPSYSQIYGLDEWRKWTDYVGTRIRVHNKDFSQDAIVVMAAVLENNTLVVTPDLPFVPDTTHVVDLAPYSNSTDPSFEETVKLIHCFWDQTILVATGISTTQFTIGSGDAGRLIVNRQITVHNDDFSETARVIVTEIAGTTITTEDMGFTPSAGFKVEMVPWYDGRAPYLFYI